MTCCNCITGSLEIGFSARLQSRSQAESASWNFLKGWKTDDILLVFNYGFKFDKDQTSVSIPFGGLYFVSANLLINSEINSLIKTCVSDDHCQKSDQNEKIVTVAFVSYFTAGQNINVSIFANRTITVNSKSSFAIQYLGSLSSMPGFVTVVKKLSTAQLTHAAQSVTLKGWERENNIYSASKAKQGASTFH